LERGPIGINNTVVGDLQGTPYTAAERAGYVI